MPNSFQTAFGLSRTWNVRGERIAHALQYIFIAIILATIAGSIALFYMNDKEQRKTLLKTLIGLNIGIVLPSMLLSTIKMTMERGLPWRHYRDMASTLLTLIVVNPATYLSIAYILEDMPQYATVQKGIFVGTAILPILTVPYYLIMFMWAFCSNFRCI
jgi:uncharacterized membrane protein YeaQ/YmgE (transglycosylase-associated protein family)